MYLENKIINLIKLRDRELALCILNSEEITTLDENEIGGLIVNAAAENGYFDIVKSAVEKGGDVNNSGSGPGKSSLSSAAYCSDYEMFSFLLDNGADLSIQGDAAMSIACGYGNLEIIKLMHKKGFDVAKAPKEGQVVDHFTAWAATFGHIETVEYLLKHGASAVEMDNAAIIAAGISGREVCIRVLQKHGADINARSGETMALCAMHNNPINMQITLDAGFDLTKNVANILSHCVTFGNVEAITWLQKNDVDLTRVPIGAILALKSRSSLDDPVFTLLKDAGVDVNAILENDLSKIRMSRQG